MKNKKKGFTLIELLVAILIVALVGTVGFISIKAIIDNSKEKSNALNISNIIKGARSYTEEFKTMDKYWFVDNETNEEYSCTTVGMLINKGFLKDSILDTVIGGKNVTRDTSIKIKRNKNTKVNDTEDILFNNITCDELADIKMEFDISGETGNSGWYIKDVNVKISVTNANQIDKDEEPSYVIKDDSGNVRDASVTSKENENEDNWQLKVGDEGRKLNLCVSIINLKDKYQTYCLSDSNKEYNMDKTKPSMPNLVLNPTSNNYVIVSNGASDNVTNESNLKYFINYDENLEEKEHSLDLGTRVSAKTVSTYVEDEAGNKSDTYVSTLNITDPKNDTPTSRVEYHCSLDNNKYDNYDDVVSACNKTITGNVTSSTYYTCSLDSKKNKRYDSYDSAKSDCQETIYGIIDSEIANDVVTVEGSCTYHLMCDSTHTWCSKGQDCTDYGCPTGYNKTWSCEHYGGGGYCPTQNEERDHEAKCVNTCTKPGGKIIYTCSVTGRQVSGLNSDCSKTVTGIVPSTPITDYYCDLTKLYYSSNDAAINDCTKSQTGKVNNITIYTCSLDNKDYDTNDKAISACTNYCSIGKYHSNSCYDFK